MALNRRIKLGALGIGLILLAAFLVLPFVGQTAYRSPLTPSLSNAKMLADACKLFSDDHEGKFPRHLKELIPDYLSEDAFAPYGLSYRVIVEEKTTSARADWLYFGAGFDQKNPPKILIAAPQAVTVQGHQRRIYIDGNLDGFTGEESDYQKLLAETVRQMRSGSIHAPEESSPPAKVKP